MNSWATSNKVVIVTSALTECHASQNDKTNSSVKFSLTTMWLIGFVGSPSVTLKNAILAEDFGRD
jgi:hypothetical protein